MGKVGGERMNDGFEMFIGVVASFCGLALIGLGYAAGQYQIANHCKTFGAFEHGVIYECKEKK